MSKGAKGRKNLQAYTFGGMTNIKNTKLYSDIASPGGMTTSEQNQSLETPMGTGREVLTGFGQSQQVTNPGYVTLSKPTRPKVPNFFDQAYGTDPKKRLRQRPQSCKSGYSRRSNIMEKIKAYKAPDPYR